jgi:hypothetical protein
MITIFHAADKSVDTFNCIQKLAVHEEIAE